MSKKQRDQSPKLNKEQFRRAIEEAPIATIMQAEDGQVLLISRSWTELTGYSITDIPTFDNWVSNLVYDGADAIRNHMLELFKGNERSINVEFTVRTHNEGIRVWSLSASSPGTLLDGRRFIIGMMVDITERKKADEALQKVKELTALAQERERLERILQMTPVGVVILEAPDGKFSYANKRAIELYGFDTIGLNLEENVTRVKARRADGTEYPVEKMPVSRTLRFGEEVHNEEMIIERPDGRAFPIIASTAPLMDMHGKITAAIVVFEDIIERKITEEALIKSKEEYRSLFENMMDGFAYCQMIFDKYGKPIDFIYLEINDSFERITGLKRHQVIGRKITEAIPGTERANPEIFEIYGRVASTCKKEKFEIFFKPLKLWLSISVYCPRIGYFAAVFEDITERKKTESELERYGKNLEQLVEERTKQLKDAERLAAIGATAGMVGHDIRNPLQAIIGDVFLLKDFLSSMPEMQMKKDVAESLNSIENNVEYINKIVQDLQDFTRPLTPLKETLNLEDVCKEALYKKAIPPNVTATCMIEEEAKKLYSDPAFLKRILANLVNNAVQAMPQGGKVAIKARKKANNVIITVNDTGIGIPEEVKGKLFTPMFTTKSKGQGFGLAAVKRMTEALGGTVTFESQEGRGAKFTIELPINQ